MNLSFHKRFVPKILDGTKIHTIREDKYNGWYAGRLIHFCTGLRTKAYRQFKKGYCISTKRIEVKWSNNGNRVETLVDGKIMLPEDGERLARNDGFDNLGEFLAWFNKDFTGKIIHWTNFRYD